MRLFQQIGRGLQVIGHANVLRTETSNIVGGQSDVHLVVAVKPLGMMVDLLSQQGHSRHEAEGLVEVLQDELLENGIAALHQSPAGFKKGLQLLSTLLFV
ncbi:hypothetical protein M5D96_002567 [Drosophila gunungcola]|uniref:Uncharacterized protein n=1 Tax=Drosophila gunungcola TaxID=103775 RepID=A0A9P9Z0K7_9MUSC|nr:hypothetical protein M5D96_002567 [Drosophila gunungcola]